MLSGSFCERKICRKALDYIQGPGFPQAARLASPYNRFGGT
jgi:hypothetical protein